jgi:two-component system OmpR family response regulator
MASHSNRIITALFVGADPAIEDQVMRCIAPHFRTTRARTLYEAAEFMRLAQPTIVVLDPELPDGDGIEWLRALRVNPEAANVIIVCVTRRSAIRDKVRGFMAGADDYIIAPIDPETFPYRLMLLNRIRRH